ncbi:MAG: YfiT family bacillithiol transferase [Bacteroidota bacterium]
MIKEDVERLKYPVGHFQKPEPITSTTIKSWIKEIENFPVHMKKAVEGLSPAQLNWQYRSGGWTIKQVIHHCADSHMNSLIRFKLAITEDRPVIRPYFEDRWAELPDSLDPDVSVSLILLEALHKKWVRLLRHLSEDDLKRVFIHPEHGKSFSVEENIGIYAWHCRHHLAHVRNAIEMNQQ